MTSSVSSKGTHENPYSLQEDFEKINKNDQKFVFGKVIRIFNPNKTFDCSGFARVVLSSNSGTCLTIRKNEKIKGMFNQLTQGSFIKFNKSTLLELARPNP